ncbi:hypothetical protein FA95DRAFT_1603964 [Auriscalpium vulgare]|uniref:Uncharacterized protein n=1 Tax=Auriscalpium vulgare TaxID=40419 RepID=A0ACB8S079_9AGAM|nr:hypothetical protein FA95DRAFT_1603964 [Auriscalpium vulgare]
MQLPTVDNVRIRNTQDVHRIFYAVHRGILPMISRRLDAKERDALASGCCYAWEDRGPHAITGLGIERFTEGRHWSASRVRDEFLFYYEKWEPPKNKNGDGPSTESAPRDWDPLVKQTYSVFVNDGSSHRRKWHLTAYFTQATVDRLGTVDDIPALHHLTVPPGMFRSSRTIKSRRGAAPAPAEPVASSSSPPAARVYAQFPSTQRPAPGPPPAQTYAFEHTTPAAPPPPAPQYAHTHAPAYPAPAAYPPPSPAPPYAPPPPPHQEVYAWQQMPGTPPPPADAPAALRHTSYFYPPGTEVYGSWDAFAAGAPYVPWACGRSVSPAPSSATSRSGSSSASAQTPDPDPGAALPRVDFPEPRVGGNSHGAREELAGAGGGGLETQSGLAPLNKLVRFNPYRRDPIDDRMMLRLCGT